MQKITAISTATIIQTRPSPTASPVTAGAGVSASNNDIMIIMVHGICVYSTLAEGKGKEILKVQTQPLCITCRYDVYTIYD